MPELQAQARPQRFEPAVPRAAARVNAVDGSFQVVGQGQNPNTYQTRFNFHILDVDDQPFDARDGDDILAELSPEGAQKFRDVMDEALTLANRSAAPAP